VADYIPAADRPMQRNIQTPLTLTQLQTLVAGFVRFIELDDGDIIVINEASPGEAPFNSLASSIAGKAGPIYGDVVHCKSSEIA